MYVHALFYFFSFSFWVVSIASLAVKMNSAEMQRHSPAYIFSRHEHTAIINFLWASITASEAWARLNYALAVTLWNQVLGALAGSRKDDPALLYYVSKISVD